MTINLAESEDEKLDKRETIVLQNVNLVSSYVEV